jgi:hypothetical protein
MSSTRSSSPVNSQREFRPQFALRSLLLVVLLAALGVSGWRQWDQRREIAAWRARAQLFEREVELARGVTDAARRLDLKDPEQRRIMQLLATMDPRQGDTLVRQPIATPEGNREVLLFHHDSPHCEGAVESIALLVAPNRLVDYLIHNESDWHQARIEAPGPGEKLAIVYHCRKGSYSDKYTYTERFGIAADGFAWEGSSTAGAALDPPGKAAQTTTGRSLRGREVPRSIPPPFSP